MKIDDLEWDEANVEHVGGHSVTPAEVEDVCFGEHMATRGEHDRYVLYGQTGNGRYLKVILQRQKGNVFRPVTAFEMTERQKRAFRKKGK